MTARYARRVVLMSNDGRLIESGDPKSLMEDEDSSLYALIHKVKRIWGGYLLLLLLLLLLPSWRYYHPTAVVVEWFVRELLSASKRSIFTCQVGGGERLKRQRSEEGSFLADAAGSKAEPDREKNQLVKEEHRLVVYLRESRRSEQQDWK